MTLVINRAFYNLLWEELALNSYAESLIYRSVKEFPICDVHRLSKQLHSHSKNREGPGGTTSHQFAPCAQDLSVMAFRAPTCGSTPRTSMLRDQTQDLATPAFSGGLAAVRAVWRQLSEMDSGSLVFCHVSFGTRIGSTLTLAMNFGVSSPQP